MPPTKSLSTTQVILFAGIFLTLFYNTAFFANTIKVYPLSSVNLFFLVSIGVVFTCFQILLLKLISAKFTIKPILIIIFMVSALTSYFMNSYNIIIDDAMIQNAIETDPAEAMDLFSFKLIAYLVFLGILPSFAVYKIRIRYGSLKTELFSKLKVVGISLVLIIAMLLSFSRYYTSFFREHKPLRQYTNPSAWIYATAKIVKSAFTEKNIIVAPIGLDAQKRQSNDSRRKLIILVVGEAVRADRLSLNGYFRETTPRLEKENVISFTHMYSCGTSTNISVPCMFSIYPQKEYSKKKARRSENLLDVLHHAGVHVLWRENNSSSKGTALRVPYEFYRKADNNPICDDIECRDEGMLVGLQEYIDARKTGDFFIVLHQMGNHGPAYYKRYPKAFEKFTPVCKTNQLEQCSMEEIGNAYDNSIFYTDYFLSKTIALLKQNADQFETAMLYFSDHGESLGEKSIYLHGLPYAIAPDEQKHIGAFFWFGARFQIDRQALRARRSESFSHDNIFHTILGLMDIKTKVYDPHLDMMKNDKAIRPAP